MTVQPTGQPFWPPTPIDRIDRTNLTPARDQHPKDHDDLEKAVNAILLVLGQKPYGTSNTLTAELVRLQAAIDAGGQGGGPSGLTHYVHEQTATSDTWLVQHNLGYDPVIDVTTSDGIRILGFDLFYADDHNSLTLGFSQAIAGRALLSN